MYRILQESIENYWKDPATQGERRNLAEPIKLMLSPEYYKKEAKINSARFQQAQKLLSYLKQEENQNPRFKTLLWHLESREMIPSLQRQLTEEEIQLCEKQASILLQLIRLSYWQ